MRKKIDPGKFGLPARTLIIEKSDRAFSLVINRKSRIVMKDAAVVLKKADTIREQMPDASVCLETSAPVCSKSIRFLEENGIKVIAV